MEGVIFIGIQASGKSSFYFDRFANSHIRLNLDMLKTRHREKILFNACLESKQPCVIDNTNPTVKDRLNYIEKFKKHKFEITGYFFYPNLEQSLTLNANREGLFNIPEIGIKATHKKLEKPRISEGFDRLYLVSINNGTFEIENI